MPWNPPHLETHELSYHFGEKVERCRTPRSSLVAFIFFSFFLESCTFLTNRSSDTLAGITCL